MYDGATLSLTQSKAGDAPKKSARAGGHPRALGGAVVRAGGGVGDRPWCRRVANA